MNSKSRLRGSRRVLGGLLILAVLAAVAAAAYLKLREPRSPDPLRFTRAIGAFLAADSLAPPPDRPIVFVGSSSIRLWPTDSLFRDLPVINRGFGGSHISDVNYYAKDVVLRYSPSVVVFYAGDNDVNDGKSAGKVLRDYREFVEILRGGGPPARILFLSIKPSPSRWNAWPRMAEANELIRSFSDTDSLLEYVDLASPMLDPRGRPIGSLYAPDSLHLSAEGYRLWTGIVRPMIEE